MLQQQINYWTLREAMRHNRVIEGISQQDADTNRMNANTNIFNAKTNRMNAYSNRIQAKAATVQAGAAVRQAGAAERQAAVQERYVAVTESLRDSVEWNNYMSPLGSAMGKGVDVIGTNVGKSPIVGKSSKGPKVGADGYYKLGPSAAASALAFGAKAGAVGAGVVGGIWALNEVYQYQKNDSKKSTKPINR